MPQHKTRGGVMPRAERHLRHYNQIVCDIGSRMKRRPHHTIVTDLYRGEVGLPHAVPVDIVHIAQLRVGLGSYLPTERLDPVRVLVVFGERYIRRQCVSLRRETVEPHLRELRHRYIAPLLGRRSTKIYFKLFVPHDLLTHRAMTGVWSTHVRAAPRAWCLCV